jgi:transposase
MAKTRSRILCAWCGEEFIALSSLDRKYCGIDCAAAARRKPTWPAKAQRRITYRTPEQWREQLAEAAKKAERPERRGRRVWLVCGKTSMYTGLDGLLGIIRYQLHHDPYNGDIYVFRGFNGTMLKYLEWDGAGFCISKRHAQSGSYPWPPADAGPLIEITEKEFEFLRRKSIVPVRKKVTKHKREVQ